MQINTLKETNRLNGGIVKFKQAICIFILQVTDNKRGRSK